MADRVFLALQLELMARLTRGDPPFVSVGEAFRVERKGTIQAELDATRDWSWYPSVLPGPALFKFTFPLHGGHGLQVAGLRRK